MWKAFTSAALLVLCSAVLGATVFREQLAQAAQAILPVKVTNTSAEPVPVTSQDDPARNAFAFFKNERMDAGDAQHHLSIPVPAGKRLVIESVSGSAGFDTATEALVDISLQARVNSKLQDYNLSAEFDGRSPVAVYPYLWSATDTVRLYADGETNLDVFWTRNTASAGEANLNISIQGYLIDCTTAACA
jgi:hypothetical protein